jgi:Resolvase, N terminal domain
MILPVRAAGCGRVFTDHASGKLANRPGLAEAMVYLRHGDTLVITKLDRLGRSIKNLIDLAAGSRHSMPSRTAPPGPGPPGGRRGRGTRARADPRGPRTSQQTIPDGGSISPESCFAVGMDLPATAPGK